MSKTKACKISTLIKKLQEVQSQEGDMQIVISADADGNTFNVIDPNNELDYALDGNLLVLYPSSDNHSLNEIAGYNSTSDNDEYDDEDDNKAVDEYFEDYDCNDYNDYVSEVYDNYDE